MAAYKNGAVFVVCMLTIVRSHADISDEDFLKLLTTESPLTNQILADIAKMTGQEPLPVSQIEEVISGKSRVGETIRDGDEQSRQTNTNQHTDDSGLAMESSEDTAASAESKDVDAARWYGDKVPKLTSGINVPVDISQVEEAITGKSRVAEAIGDSDEQSRQTNTNQQTEDSDEVLVMESSENTAVSARSEDTNTEPKYDEVHTPTDTNVPVDSNTLVDQRVSDWVMKWVNTQGDGSSPAPHTPQTFTDSLNHKDIDQMTSDWVKKWLNKQANGISPGTHTPQTFPESLNHKGVLSKQVIRDVSRSMNQSPDYDQMTCDWLKKLVNTPVEGTSPVPQTTETFTDSSNYEVMFRGSDRLTEKWLRNLHNSDPGTPTYK